MQTMQAMQAMQTMQTMQAMQTMQIMFGVYKITQPPSPTILPSYHFTILPSYHFTILQFCHFTISPFLLYFNLNITPIFAWVELNPTSPFTPNFLVKK